MEDRELRAAIIDLLSSILGFFIFQNPNGP
jgi:hypothetical protein